MIILLIGFHEYRIFSEDTSVTPQDLTHSQDSDLESFTVEYEDYDTWLTRNKELFKDLDANTFVERWLQNKKNKTALEERQWKKVMDHKRTLSKKISSQVQ